MLDLTKDIRSLTEFKRNTSELVENLKRTKHPLVLTVNGKAELVVQDAESYQALLNAAELVETLTGIKKGLKQIEQNQGKNASELFSEILDQQCQTWVKPTEKQTPLQAETVLQTLRQYPNLFQKFQLKTLALFGSSVRNEATATSDLDFLVEFSAETTLNLYMDLKFFLEELFGKSVDLVTKKSLKPIIRDQILAEAQYV